MHADARTAGRHHGGDVLQRQEGHALEKSGDLRVLVDLLLLHIEELGAAGHEHGQHILLFPPLVFPVVFQQAHIAHFLQKGLQLLGRLTGDLHQLRQSHGLAHLHLQGHVRHLIGNDTRKAPVFRVLGGERA